MRPCQHCGKAIQLSDTICPLCDGEQVATVGGGTTQVAAPQVADDRTVAQRQEQVQREAENWLVRTVIIVTLSINAGLVLFGYLVGGVEGAAFAMFLVASGIVLSWIVFAVLSNGLPVGGSHLLYISLLLVILNGAGAYWLERVH
ncbi:hypothetical protein Pan258_39220 [Symmachiella dynata]|uniref:hypothetical protein n=1 Tax=Symmachiella dynata TaxID=2527995 RepID=UPI00118AA229|nr:hypothetical protein [Symmachiella dynata]QDT49867.1 hypothetical protein Pan258_39220 [Symmachiella dynata]